jgi:predicted dehydrogenase
MAVDGRPLRAGIIGCGAIAQEGHIPGLLAAGVEIGAVCDANADRAREVGERFGVTAIHTDLGELLARSDLDLVTIGLPNVLHASVAIAALEAGKHVLCEKPMSVTSAGAEAMVAAARASGKLLSVNQHMRFGRTPFAMRDAVASGSLGTVYLADVRMVRQNGIPGYGGWFTNRDLAGHGALFDIGVHMLDLVLFVLGFPEVVAVKGYLSGHLGKSGVGLGSWGVDRGRSGRYDVDDTAAATLTLARGGQIRLHVAWAAFAPAEERLTLYGTLGGLDRTAGRGAGKPSPLRFFGPDADGVIVQLPRRASGQENGGWTAAIVSFVGSVRDREPLLVRPEETLMTTRILERIVESAAEGVEIAL